jgi:tetratricopeptide (TPR) repeat protein
VPRRQLSPQAAVRVAMTAFAALAVAWLAVGLYAVELQADGDAVIAKARSGNASPAEVEQARDSFERAGDLTAGTRSRVQEAVLLVLTGRTREAAAVAEEALRDEPDNLEGWGVLYEATRERDPARAAEALRRAQELNPHVAPR